jgi:hypothetical protein
MIASPFIACALAGSSVTAGASEVANYIRTQSTEIRIHVERTISFGSAIDQLRQELASVCEEAQTPGWDGYGADPVSEETIAFACEFVNCMPSSMEMPTVTVEPDGHVSFEWYRSPNRLVSVSVGENRELNFAATIGREQDCGNRVFCGVIPKRIAQLIEEVCAA